MLQAGSVVEVRCHPGCPWFGGWEVAEVVITGGAPHYRVRRRGQDAALLALLPGDDVRSAQLVSVSAG